MDWLFNWLEAAITWFWNVVKAVFKAGLDLIHDFAIWTVDQVLTALGALISSIPVPDFLHQGMQVMFSSLDPSILYFVGLLKIPEGLTLIGTAVLFRMTRKLVTLGQW